MKQPPDIQAMLIMFVLLGYVSLAAAVAVLSLNPVHWPPRPPRLHCNGMDR